MTALNKTIEQEIIQKKIYKIRLWLPDTETLIQPKNAVGTFVGLAFAEDSDTAWQIAAREIWGHTVHNYSEDAWKKILEWTSVEPVEFINEWRNGPAVRATRAGTHVVLFRTSDIVIEGERIWPSDFFMHLEHILACFSSYGNDGMNKYFSGKKFVPETYTPT